MSCQSQPSPSWAGCGAKSTGGRRRSGSSSTAGEHDVEAEQLHLVGQVAEVEALPVGLRLADVVGAERARRCGSTARRSAAGASWPGLLAVTGAGGAERVGRRRLGWRRTPRHRPGPRRGRRRRRRARWPAPPIRRPSARAPPGVRAPAVVGVALAAVAGGVGRHRRRRRWSRCRGVPVGPPPPQVATAEHHERRGRARLGRTTRREHGAHATAGPSGGPDRCSLQKWAGFDPDGVVDGPDQACGYRASPVRLCCILLIT